MTATPTRIAGSFRDPKGQVFRHAGRIFRTINQTASEQFEFIRSNGLLTEAIAAGFLIETWDLARADWPEPPGNPVRLVEHRSIPYISYPYEWGFGMLKAAALHHLEFQLWLLDRDATLSDASAYNVQFDGAKPVFIDVLSITPYQDGAYWTGYRQFCEQFLNPLLLRALRGIPHNAWYRGALEGIGIENLAQLIGWRDLLSPSIVAHVVLHARLQQRARANPQQAVARAQGGRRLSKTAFKGLLTGLRNWISRLHPKGGAGTTWGDYAAKNTYAPAEAEAKGTVVASFTAARAPGLIMDLGCNSGDYSLIALENGAARAIGFDYDQNAVDLAFDRAQSLDLPFLPLWLDAANCSPSQGWMQAEREGFAQRATADAVIALAFEHHLAIGRNIPLDQVVAWIVSLAPSGLIEFVPKSDPTIQLMLATREDVFANYSEDAFRAALGPVARIANRSEVSQTGRVIYEFAR